ncbi:Hypothetical_protein [Hexamita inflata]|uniref:Hypothetical_protein n=1 Tax=Hexamita inflata TaxID=28002 RepID=A0AA86U826_9EUKA|nr:Hypothetical protein HINF_LOCUS34365 [Hexamita inflata]
MKLRINRLFCSQATKLSVYYSYYLLTKSQPSLPHLLIIIRYIISLNTQQQVNTQSQQQQSRTLKYDSFKKLLIDVKVNLRIQTKQQLLILIFFTFLSYNHFSIHNLLQYNFQQVDQEYYKCEVKTKRIFTSHIYAHIYHYIKEVLTDYFSYSIENNLNHFDTEVQRTAQAAQSSAKKAQTNNDEIVIEIELEDTLNRISQNETVPGTSQSKGLVTF